MSDERREELAVPVLGRKSRGSVCRTVPGAIVTTARSGYPAATSTDLAAMFASGGARRGETPRGGPTSGAPFLLPIDLP